MFNFETPFSLQRNSISVHENKEKKNTGFRVVSANAVKICDHFNKSGSG